MKPDKYALAIEQLLRQIPELERNLSIACNKEDKLSLERSLKHRRKRFEHLIPFSFRIQLRNLCKQAGISGNFLEKS